MPQKQKQILTIEEWSDAFLVYTSIYLAAHPDKTQHVLKYFTTIRTAAKRHAGLGWTSYDIQFRLRMANDSTHVSFGSIDSELWLLCMGPASLFPVGAVGGDRKCYDYNYRFCQRTSCQYRHLCVNCSKNHPAQACQRTSFTPRPRFSPRFQTQPRPFFRSYGNPRVSTPRPRY